MTITVTEPITVTELTTVTRPITVTAPIMGTPPMTITTKSPSTLTRVALPPLSGEGEPRLALRDGSRH